MQKMKIDRMYSTLPKSLTTECIVRTKVEEKGDILLERQRMVETMSTAELGHFKSIGDFPVPSALEKIFKTEQKPEVPRRGRAEKRK